MKTRMFLMSLGLALGVAVLSTTTNHAAFSVADAQQASPLPSVGPSPMSTMSPMPMGSMKPMKKKKKPTTMPSPMASGMMMSPAPMKT